mmetsp:Transcript_67317/g.208247  ORF Transcript_67317/g.208247 Transcript_67317/m.208247 type:complete len:358 (-) Transcript_67317:22-1095(-)
MNDEGLTVIQQIKVGAFIKARGKDGQYRRVSVLEVQGGDLPVKVRMDSGEKKKKPQDVWLSLSECRLIRHINVNWDGFDAKLPTGQDLESRARRREVFAAWGAKRKSLSLEQLQAGVRELVAQDIGADVEEADLCVKSAWKAARNLAPPRKKGQSKAAKTVDSKEFHAFTVALRYYLELAELFEHLDSNQEDDQRLSLRECRRGLAELQAWGITEETLAEKFKGLDPWTPVVSFEDFARLCIEERWSSMNLQMELDSSDDEVKLATAGASVRTGAGIKMEDKRYGLECMQNRKRVMEVFAKADSDGSGRISEDELVSVFAELNSRITPESARRLFQLADSNQDGQVDYEEFCLWLFQ